MLPIFLRQLICCMYRTLGYGFGDIVEVVETVVDVPRATVWRTVSKPRQPGVKNPWRRGPQSFFAKGGRRSRLEHLLQQTNADPRFYGGCSARWLGAMGNSGAGAVPTVWRAGQWGVEWSGPPGKQL